MRTKGFPIQLEPIEFARRERLETPFRRPLSRFDPRPIRIVALVGQDSCTLSQGANQDIPRFASNAQSCTRRGMCVKPLLLRQQRIHNRRLTRNGWNKLESLRHANFQITADVYVQDIPQAVRSAHAWQGGRTAALAQMRPSYCPLDPDWTRTRWRYP